MKKISLLTIAIAIGMLLTAGQAFANPGLEATCVYRLYYQDSSSNWIQVLPSDAPGFYTASTLWKYSYTLSNTTPSPETNKIDWWHVYYKQNGVTYTSGITQTGIPTGWNVGSGGISTGVFVDSTDGKVQWSSNDGDVYKIPARTSMSGWEYTFNWSDLQNIPGSQHYEAGNGGSFSGETVPVPEPTSMVLLGMGLVGLVGRKLRSKFQQ